MLRWQLFAVQPNLAWHVNSTTCHHRGYYKKKYSDNIYLDIRVYAQPIAM